MTTDAVTDFEVEGDRLEVVKDFVLWGSQVNEDARSRPEIRRRIALGRAAMGNLRHIMLDKTLAISVKVKIIQTMVFPIVTYGSESWTVMKEDRRKIDAFELWCWRRACRVNWTDKVSNKSILTWVAPYNKLSLDARILKLKMSYFGHVMRRNGMEKDIMLGKVGGRRRRGRQRMRCMEGILTETGNGLKELRELVESRHEWRAFIHRVTNEPRKAERMTSSSQLACCILSPIFSSLGSEGHWRANLLAFFHLTFTNCGIFPQALKIFSQLHNVQLIRQQHYQSKHKTQFF